MKADAQPGWVATGLYALVVATIVATDRKMMCELWLVLAQHVIGK